MRFLKTWGIIIHLFLSSVLAHGQNREKEGDMTVPEYITKYYGLAKEEMRRTGIPASIKLAQGILESSYGNSKLSKKANNHFGIKCGSNWEGATFIQDDDEEKECFRKYETVYQSYRDHSLFLIGKDRYAALFKLKPTDYKGWAQGLKKAGYATNPNYATLLIRLIEERNLHAFDTESKYVPLTAEEAGELKAMDNKYFMFNGIKTVVSQPNEMAFDIATKYDVSIGQLLRFNDLNEGDYILPGSKIYLQPKRTKGYETYHRVTKGETMHSISQMEGIKLKALYKKNRMTWGQEPAVGETLCLQRTCDKAPKLKTEAEIKRDIEADIQKRMDEAVKGSKEKEPKAEVASEEKGEEAASAPAQQEAEAVKTQGSKEPAVKTDAPVAETAAPPETVKQEMKPVYHQVASQETLYRISTLYNTTVVDIKKWNNLTSSSVSPGQMLIVGYSSGTDGAPAKEEQPVVKEEPVKKPASPPSKPKLHTVAPQETLYRISTIYKVTVDDIKKWNRLASSEISIGQKLIVGYEQENVKEEEAEMTFEEEPVQPEVITGQPAGLPTYHKVKEGETLYTIAQAYNLNVETLKKLNSLVASDIKPGQVLKLK